MKRIIAIIMAICLLSVTAYADNDNLSITIIENVFNTLCEHFSLDNTQYDYILIRYGDDTYPYRLKVFAKPNNSSHAAWYNTSEGRFYNGHLTGYDGRIYTVQFNTYEEISSYSGPVNYNFIIIPSTDILYSTVNIYTDNTGNSLFIPRDKLLTVSNLSQLVEKKLLQETQKLRQTIHTLVLCGVGCLALLIAFILLKKVLGAFLRT